MASRDMTAPAALAIALLALTVSLVTLAIVIGTLVDFSQLGAGPVAQPPLSQL